MRWTCAILLLLAGGRAARVVVEDFATYTGGLWTDTGQVLGLPESVQPPVGTIQLTTVGEALRVDYDVAFKALYGVVTLGRVLNGTNYDRCANATHASLKYKVLAPQSRPHLGTLLFALLDGSDCSGPACAEPPGTALELWMHHDAVALDDASAGWRELRLGLCGKSGTTQTPLFNMDGFYANGNYALDPDSLQGFVIGVQTPSDRRGEVTSGSLLFDEIACIEDAGAGPCAEPANRTGDALSEVQFVPSAASEVHEWGHQQCDELCAASETCLYYMTSGGLDALNLRFPTCYLYDALRAEDLRPASAVDFETSALESFWVQSEAKRGELCEVCTCVSSAANCTNRDLKTVPFGSDPITSLDLRGNPQLVLIGPGAFEISLETLALPSGIAHVAPEALLALPALREVSVAEGGDSVPRNFVDASGTGRFHDVCCGRGASVADISFCAFEPDEPGKSDTMYREFERTAFDNIIEALPTLALYVPSSPFLAEASESVDKCAAVCAMNARCLSFSFYIRTFTFCHLYTEAPSVSAYEGGAAPDPDGAVRIIGLPPRTRAARNSTVVVSPASLELSEANEYKDSFEVSLGADPLRGAVWVTPRLETDLGVLFEPPSVSLYDATTRVTIEVSVRGDVTRDFTPTVTFDVEACDPAFSEVKPTVQLDILEPPGSSKDNSHRRKARNLRIAMITLGALLGAALVTWSCVRGRESLVRARRLARERRWRVHDQILEARSLLREFRSLFATVKGDEFLGLGGVGGSITHETLLDTELQLFDGVEKCDAARRRGEVFMFLSHQWTAFTEPDPTGVQYEAMCAAVRAVAREAGVEVSALHVWVDILAIPQRNRALQRMAIESLPAFASTCDYFVVVAPPCSHQNGDACDIDSFRARAWCRAEVVSCWAMRGADCMYLSAGEGLVPLLAGGEVDALAEHIDVFGGDLTCCARGHPDHVCDREALVKPMLGLFVEIYERHRNPRDGAAETYQSPDSVIRTTPDLESPRTPRTPRTPRSRPPKDAYAVVEPLLERLYPRTFDWRHTADGEFVVETVPLFGDLIDAARYYVDRGLLDKRRVDDDNVPDFEPGSDGRCHDAPDGALERSRLLRQRSTLQSFRHLLPPRSLSLSLHSTQSEAFRRMPSRSGGSSMRSVGTNSTAYGSPRRSSSTASARSARLFLGPRSLGAE